MKKLSKTFSRLPAEACELITIVEDQHPWLHGKESDDEMLKKCTESIYSKTIRIAIIAPIVEWLEEVMYALSPYAPLVSPDNAINFALGQHGVALWLFEYGKQVKAACALMYILGEKRLDKMAIAVIRLPGIVTIFENMVFPHMEQLHKNTLDKMALQYVGKINATKEEEEEEKEKESE